jgi:hypothetical protein
VTVPLASTGPQDTGGGGTDTFERSDIEDLIGSPFADLLGGDEGANEIAGGDGEDTVVAGGGADTVDLVDGEGGDIVDCGDSGDVARVDGDGGTSTDLVANCEEIEIIDSRPPDTEITAGPPDRLSKKKATYEFTSPNPAATFECSLDSEPFGSCAPPHVIRRLKKGSHEFAVRAVNEAGIPDGTPSEDSFRVVRG